MFSVDSERVVGSKQSAASRGALQVANFASNLKHTITSGRRRRALLAPLCALCLLLTGGIASGQNPPGAGAAPVPPSAINARAKELLDRAIQALGGSAFLKFKTMTTAGRVFAISDESTTGFAPFESAVAFPDKRRFAFGRKQPVTLINDGDRAWELDRLGVTHQLPEQRRRWKLSTIYGLENLLRLHIHDPGLLIQDGGVDFVDNVPAWVVAITEPGGGLAKLYLNKQNYLPVRIDYQDRDPKTKEFDDFTDVYGDYQLVEGVQTPMRIARFLNGERVGETFRSTVRYGEEYPAGYFEPPAR